MITVPLRDGAFHADIRLRWLEAADHWFLTVRDAADGRLLVDGIPLVSGTGVRNDLFRPFRHLGIGSLFCRPNRDEVRYTDPGETNLGSFNLIWTEAAEA